MSRQGWIAAVVLGLLPVVLVALWVSQASGRLQTWADDPGADEQQVAVASALDAEYCSVELKRILRRVLQSCGLLGKGGVRGCKPLKAKNVATVSGRDFNALFQPMKDRGGIVQFDAEESSLDPRDKELIDAIFADQRGASYFFVVSRASPDGDVVYNRNLSKSRAESVMNHLRDTFNDPDLDREVGLLWLGEEFAQLDQAFCDWRRSAGGNGTGNGNGSCRSTDLNRGAFISWIDCQL